MENRLTSGLAALLVVVVAFALPPFAPARADEVNIYSYRQEHLIKPQPDAFTRATGIRYNLVTGGAGALIQRIRREDANSPADVLLTADAGRLVRAKDLDILQPVRSAALESAIPTRLAQWGTEGWTSGAGCADNGRARTNQREGSP